MGKYVLLVVFGALSIWGMSMAQFQSQKRAAEDEAEHYRATLARQAARAGLSVIRTRAAEAEDKNQCPSDIVGAVPAAKGTDESGDYRGGRYEARLQPVPSLNNAFQAVSEGTYEGKTSIAKKLVTVQNSDGGFFYVEKRGSGRASQYPTPDGGGFETHPQIRAMGPLALDLDGDGQKELPYIRKSNRKIEMIDSETKSAGQAQTLVNANVNGRRTPATSKTQMATGKWGEGPPSVFYANANGDALYRVSWGPKGNGPKGNGLGGNGKKNQNAPEMVASLGNSRNGAGAVVGIGDVNGDPDKELVFVDGSQELRYMDRPGDGDREKGDHQPGTAFPKIPGGSVGSNNGVGAGAFVDLSGDVASSVVFVNGSNNIQIVNDGGVNRTIRVGNVNGGNGPGAAKAPPAVLDVDGDGGLEVAYVMNGSDQVQHVDIDPEDPNRPRVETLDGPNAPSVRQGPGLQASSTSPCGK
jgi:hypothetical protein